MPSTKKCNVCGVVYIQEPNLTCSRCTTSPLDEIDSIDLVEDSDDPTLDDEMRAWQQAGAEAFWKFEESEMLDKDEED